VAAVQPAVVGMAPVVSTSNRHHAVLIVPLPRRGQYFVARTTAGPQPSRGGGRLRGREVQPGGSPVCRGSPRVGAVTWAGRRTAPVRGRDGTQPRQGTGPGLDGRRTAKHAKDAKGDSEVRSFRVFCMVRGSSKSSRANSAACPSHLWPA
jgi:hypothetical protein